MNIHVDLKVHQAINKTLMAFKFNQALAQSVSGLILIEHGKIQGRETRN